MKANRDFQLSLRELLLLNICMAGMLYLNVVHINLPVDYEWNIESRSIEMYHGTGIAVREYCQGWYVPFHVHQEYGENHRDFWDWWVLVFDVALAVLIVLFVLAIHRFLKQRWISLRS